MAMITLCINGDLIDVAEKMLKEGRFSNLAGPVSRMAMLFLALRSISGSTWRMIDNRCD